MKIYTAHILSIPDAKTHIFPLMEGIENSILPVDIVSSIEASDVVVVPINIQYLFLNGKKKEFFKISEATKKAGKKLLVFSGSDYGLTLLDAHIIQVRLGGFKASMSDSTYIMPPFIKDPYELLQKDYVALTKNESPNIGFVGHSNGSFIKYTKEFLLFLFGNIKRLLHQDYTDYQSFYPSSRKRFIYLEMLENTPKIMSNFIYRAQYRAGAISKEDKQRTSLEFYQNICDNLYTFCLRGTGNFSVRLYETLAMGRIPVLVNTGSKLPFEETIKWSNHAFIIEEKEVKELPRFLLQFHNAHSHEALVQIQNKNRLLWKDFFQKESYFKELVEQLKTN